MCVATDRPTDRCRLQRPHGVTTSCCALCGASALSLAPSRWPRPGVALQPGRAGGRRVGAREMTSPSVSEAPSSGVGDAGGTLHPPTRDAGQEHGGSRSPGRELAGDRARQDPPRGGGRDRLLPAGTLAAIPRPRRTWGNASSRGSQVPADERVPQQLTGARVAKKRCPDPEKKPRRPGFLSGIQVNLGT